MICWGLGGFGLGLTGHLETNTKEDMGAHAQLIVLWGANLASQPNTARHVIGGAPARRPRRHHRRARDGGRRPVRRDADRAPGQRRRAGARHDARDRHRGAVGPRVRRRATRSASTPSPPTCADYTPAWAAEVTGVPAERIVALARRYAPTKPAMIVRGRQQHAQGRRPWTGARAIGCLPALTGNVGIPGGGFGPRHGSATHGQALGEHHRRGPPPARRLDPEPDAARHRGDARRPAARDAAARHQHALVLRRRRPRGRGARAHGPGRRLRPVPQRHRPPLRRRGAAGDRVAGGARLQEHQHAPLPDAEGARAAGRGAPGRLGPARAGAAARTCRTSSRGRTRAGRSTRSSTTRPPATPPSPRSPPRAACARCASRTSAIRT